MTERNIQQWASDSRAMVSRHIDRSFRAMTIRHQRELRRAASNPADLEIIKNRHEHNVLRHERARENALLRLETDIERAANNPFWTWENGLSVPRHVITNYDLEFAATQRRNRER